MSKRGGKRKGSGRKKIDDKKVPVTVYVRESQVEKIKPKLIKTAGE